MIKTFEDYFTSGWKFNADEYVLKSKYQMMNIGIILSSVSMLYGIILNQVTGHYDLSFVEFSLLLFNIMLVLLLRKDKKYLLPVAHLETAFMSTLILYLIYFVNPMELKHVWIFTYPIVILYFKNEQHALAWIVFLILMVIIAPLQPFIDVQYNIHQIITLTFVLTISTIIVYFYQLKMQEARALIYSQSQMLKTKIAELTKKDKLMTMQSKQAVMGEMISMIAHQWRQPLSSVTLNISNFQVKKLLGEDICGKELDTMLENISDTVVYLSDTINDFQTYFHPNKESSEIEVSQLIQKAINFTLPRVKDKDTKIEIMFAMEKEIVIQTYANEIIQVLLNILNNAIDELLEMHIKDPKVIICVIDKEDDIIIEVHDNAGGIQEENLESIFEPYFSTKGKNGTGLGLYMSQMIMQKQFNSDIVVESKNAETVFKVRVPKRLS